MSKTSNNAKIDCIKPWLQQLQNSKPKQQTSKADLVKFKRNNYEK